MGEPQIIRTDGEELVVLVRRDYDALLAQLGDEAAEDAMTVRIVKETDEAIALGHDLPLPESVWTSIEDGANPARVLREFRGLTQIELARRACVSQPTLSRIERGAVSGSTETLRSIARALAAPVGVLLEQAWPMSKAPGRSR